MSVRDRAALVAEALARDIADTLSTVARNQLKQRIEEILRDEFADQRAQGVADRELPDP
jgi:hypothetical protein